MSLTLANPTLGYLGYATVNNNQVLVTGGNVDFGQTPVFDEMVYCPDTGNCARVKHSEGVRSPQGTVSFELADADGDGLTTLIDPSNRGTEFPIVMGSGVRAAYMSACKASSISVQGEPGGLISGSLSFMSSVVPSFGDYTPGAYVDLDPVPYWSSGAEGLVGWSVTVSQGVQPVFGNNTSDVPLYLRVGVSSVALEARFLADATPSSTINIGTGNKTITLMEETGRGYQYPADTDLPVFSYTYESYAVTADGSQMS